MERAIELMREKAVRRLPVLEGGKPVGVVSLGDLAIKQDVGSVLADISDEPDDRWEHPSTRWISPVAGSSVRGGAAAATPARSE